MSKFRINELARQLERKSREVIDKLHELGIAEKVTHSSSIDDDMADKLRRYYAGDGSVRVRPPRDTSGADVEEEGSDQEWSPDEDSTGSERRIPDAPPAAAAATTPP